ncbi:TolC family protein [Flavicella sediminum]|uniref:TolC family protein n=1 Tax=Flavicella sediminum TaxID=2585141 RepID=UPI00111DA93C|nr:TolC family protein [Flavicella sediminum]
MRNKTLILLALLFASVLQAQEMKSSFSLKEAINYALKHNRKVKNADLNIQAAEKQKWETTATGLPQINGKIDYTNNIVTPFPAPSDPNDPTYIFGFMFPKHSLKPDVTLTQLIFDGKYIVALQASKVFLAISKNAKEKTDNEIKKAVIAAYSNAMLTQESLTILQRNIATVKKNLKETSIIFKNGLTEEENVEQLQLTLSNLKNNYRNMENLKSISENYVKLLLGMEVNNPIELTDSMDTLILDHISLQLIDTKQSIFNNVDYKIAENDSKSKELLYKLEKNRTLPTIGGYLSSNYLSFTNSSFNNLYASDNKWLGTVTAGIRVEFPIFTSFQGRAKKQRAKIEWEIAQNDLKETADQVSIETAQLKSEYKLAIDTYYNRQKNLALAERIENKNSIKYKEGLASSFDLRQAQTQLYNSQQEFLQSMINVINKKAELENALNIK